MGIIVALKIKNGKEEFIAIDPKEKENYKEKGVSILCPFCKDSLEFVEDRFEKYFWRHTFPNSSCKKFPEGIGVDKDRKIF